MIELRYLDILHFVIEECHHLANGCTAKCDCISLMLFHYLPLCLGAIICDINTIGVVLIYMHAESVTLWLQVVQLCTRRLHCP